METIRTSQAAATVSDVSISSRTERLEHENEQLHRMLDLAPGCIIIHDQDGRILYANKFGCTLHGYTHDEFLQLHIKDVLAVNELGEAPAKIAAFFERNEPVSFESMHLRKDGSTFPMLVNLRETRWNGQRVLISVDSDLSGQKKAEREADRAMMRAEKLESLGILAAGIAHDFNNLLNGVFGYIDLARQTADDEKTRRNLDKAFGVFDTAKELASRLVTFSKGGAPSLNPLEAAALLRITVTEALNGSSITPDFAIDADLATCNADKEQLTQVFKHVTRNAVDAMSNCGKLDITAVNVPAGSDPQAPSVRRSYIRITFTDHGTGITPEHLPHIFDPFFTTKPQHNGLGLTTVYAIMKRHHGTISIESNAGSGTTATIYLPAQYQQISPTV